MIAVMWEWIPHADDYKQNTQTLSMDTNHTNKPQTHNTQELSMNALPQST